MAKKTPKQKSNYSVNVDVPIDHDTETIILQKADQDPEDCFTKQWSPAATLCSLCADNELCSILLRRRNKKKEKQVPKNTANFLDESDLRGVKDETLLSLLQKYKDVYLEDLIVTVGKLAKLDDEVALRRWVERFLKRHKITLTKENKLKHG